MSGPPISSSAGLTIRGWLSGIFLVPLTASIGAASAGVLGTQSDVPLLCAASASGVSPFVKDGKPTCTAAVEALKAKGHYPPEGIVKCNDPKEIVGGIQGVCTVYINGYGFDPYIWTFPDPNAGTGSCSTSLAGASWTKALPAGAPLAQVATVTSNGAPAANKSVTIQLERQDGLYTLAGRTDSLGRFEFAYVPPYLRAAKERITASAQDCSNTATKEVVVEPCDACEPR